MRFSPLAARRAAVTALLAASPLTLAGDRPAVRIPPDHLTKGELTAFRATPSYAETLAFLERLQATSPYLKLAFYGTSAEGRRMPVVVVSKEKAFTPEAAAQAGKPVILVNNGIHAGEIDGKDACLILLRDLALGNRPELLEKLTLLVVPIYNVDGHERVSRYNRPNQDGPEEGMGFRTTAQGLDLNRDFLKADAPETRALLSLATAWKPDLFVDDHVTDGADYQATITVSHGSEPATPRPLQAWLDAAVPAALARIEEEGIRTAPYVEFVDWQDPAKGIDPGPLEPRYATGYFPLRSVPAILVESHAMKTNEERVRGDERFLSALLGEVARDPQALLSARAAARDAVRKAAPGTPFVLAGETDRSTPETITLPTYAFTRETSPITGRPRLRYDRSRPLELKVPFYRHVKAKTTASRPAAYLVPAGWSAVEERLTAHGVPFVRLKAPVTLPVGTFRASEAVFDRASYQGRVRVRATIARGVETRTVPAGSLYVPLDTELAPVAIHLLEPDGPDSLFSWGLLSAALETKEYIDGRVLDPLAQKMLGADPALAAAWKKALEDPRFAADARARHLFFYRRSPYWDESVGLLPVYRLEAPLPELTASPSAAAAASSRG